MIKFYNEMPEMEFFSGDTLPVFTVEVETESVSDCSMVVTIAKANAPETAVVSKECIKTSNGFQVQLTSEDTFKLKEGAYTLNFRMTDPNNTSYIKLSGLVYVRAAAGG